MRALLHCLRTFGLSAVAELYGSLVVVVSGCLYYGDDVFAAEADRLLMLPTQFVLWVTMSAGTIDGLLPTVVTLCVIVVCVPTLAVLLFALVWPRKVNKLVEGGVRLPTWRLWLTKTKTSATNYITSAPSTAAAYAVDGECELTHCQPQGQVCSKPRTTARNSSNSNSNSNSSSNGSGRADVDYYCWKQSRKQSAGRKVQNQKQKQNKHGREVSKKAIAGAGSSDKEGAVPPAVAPYDIQTL